ncbi:MAG: aldehyde dehydrogenase family protein [Candidatus Diapherotrites archaeon]|nr:aldehyde dehydrogenase family protein [Candidatus Diapherotrites archaeon]
MKRFGLFIGGKWVSPSSRKYFPSINPATEKPIARFASGSEHDVKHAIEAAEAALPQWRKVPAPKRGQILLKFAGLLRRDKEPLARLVSTEMGKVLPEARGDVQEAIDIAEYMAGEGRRLFGHTTPSELPDKFAFTMRVPLGVCSLITPWNFPLAIPAWKTMPALVCGNTVVFKPSSDTPMCAARFVELLAKAGVPPGVVNMVTGSGEELGEALVASPKVRGVSFTGNKQTGAWIAKNAGVKKVGLELGGKNAIIIMDDADLDLALQGVLWGAFGTTGQRCTAASRVIVHEKVKKEFEHMLVRKASLLKLGPGTSPSTDVGPLINKKALEKVHYYTEVGLGEGAKLLLGGRPAKGKGFFYEPTIFSDVSPKMRIAREELFGPSLSIISASGVEEAIKIANSIEYGLSSSIYTRDISNAFRAIEGIEAGITYVNSSTIGAEVHLPFGGVKGTGNGAREAGWTGVEEFSEIKTVYIDFSGKLQKAQIDN